MSEFDLEEITDRAGTGAPNFTHGFNINGSDSGISVFTHTVGTTEPSSPSNGDTWWNTDNDSYNVYIDGEWKGWLGDTYSSVIAWGGVRGFRFGGNLASGNVRSNVIDYWAIATTGNATDFGDLTSSRYSAGAASSGTRAIMAGGYAASAGTNVIDYITCATTGNATDFGDMTYSPYANVAVSDSTRASIVGGYASGKKNNIEYVTIATTGNATDQCDLLSGLYYLGGWNDATRGVMAGGLSPATNVIQYFTIQSTNNAADFGDLSNTWQRPQGGGDDTRSCFLGGRLTGSPNSNTWTDTIEYVTTQTLGNSTDFGNLTDYGDRGATSCDGTYCCVIRGEYGGGGRSNVIDRFTVQTLGDATDFGDITENIEQPTGTAGNAS